MNLIKFEKENGVARIELNRPEVYNSFNREMALELQNILDECESDKAVRAIVLTGNGKAFCAGQDLKEVTSKENNPGFEKIIKEHYNPIILKIRNIEKPVIAAVNGVAAGAGANIALACDIVVAKESAHFIQAFSLIGLIPDSGGTYFLPRLIGFQKASALAMLGDKINAIDAEAMGMIYKYFADDEFTEEISRLSIKLANMPTKGLGKIKRALNKSLINNLEQQLDLELELQVAAAQTEDSQEGVRAFIEKRQPKFTGN